MAQLISLTTTRKNNITSAGTVLFNVGRISNVTGGSASATFNYNEGNKTVQWNVSETGAAVITAMTNYDAGTNVSITVDYFNNIATAQAVQFSVDKIVYVRAGGSASLVFVEGTGGMDKYSTATSVAAILATVNAEDETTGGDETISGSLAVTGAVTMGSSLSVTGALTAGSIGFSGTTTLTLGATASFNLDADTTDHTGAYVMNINTGVNAADVDALRINLDIGTALVGEVAKGVYVDANGLTASDTSSLVAAYDATVTMPVGDISDGVGYRVIFDGNRNQAIFDYGLLVDANSTINHASARFYGVFADLSGMTVTLPTSGGVDALRTSIIDGQAGIRQLVTSAGTSAQPFFTALAAFQGGNVFEVNLTASETSTGAINLLDFDTGGGAIYTLGAGFRGLNLDFTYNGTAGVAQNGQALYGTYIDTTTGDEADSAVTHYGRKGTTAIITADRETTNFGVDFGNVYSNTSAGDFDLTDVAASGVMKLTYSHTAATTVGAKTDPDLFRGTALLIDVDGTTNDANTKLDMTARAFDATYTLTETTGTLRWGATDIARITMDNSAALAMSSAGAFGLDMFELNADAVTLNDANITFSMVHLDSSAITNTSSANAYSINISQGAATQAIFIDAATIPHSGTSPVFDLNLTVATTTTVNAIDVAIGHDTGMTGGGEVVKAYNTTLTGLAANANGSAAHGYYVQTAPVSTERADYSGYTVDLAGVRDTADTDAGLTIGFTGTTATATSYGTRVSATSYTHTSGTWYGHYVNHTANVVAGTAYGGSINVDSVDYNNAKYGLYISKTMTGAATADRTNSLNATEIALSSTNTTGGDFDMLTTANALRVGLTHTVNSGQVKTGPDTLSGRSIYASVAGTTSQPNDALTVTAPIMLAEYTLTETDGTLTMNAANLIGIEVNTAGTPTFGNVAVNMYSVVYTDASTPVYDGSGTTVAGLSLDFTSMTDAANLSLYGIHFDMPAFSTATMAHIRAEETLITDMLAPTIGSGFGDAEQANWIPFGKRATSGVFVTELLLDITGLQNSGTQNDIIGDDGEANCHFGQLLTTTVGTIQAAKITCVETPAGGNTDVDFYCAVESTGAENALITGLTETLLVNHGAWTEGDEEIIPSTTLPAVNQYLYIADGTGGGGDQTYTAGRFLITLYGT